MDVTRRIVLGGMGSLATTSVAAAAADETDAAWLQTALERYMSFGIKAAGGTGDSACGAWLEQELTHAGYRCERHTFDAPFFETRAATLTCGDAQAKVIPQALVVATGPQGLSAPLRLADAHGDLSNSIALVRLPYKRWIALGDPDAAQPLADALRRGARAAVLITTGPTGEAIALNVSATRPGFDKSVAILAPKDAAPFIAAAVEGKSATLTLDGQGGRRPAFNLIARLNRKAADVLVISTPRSGWFACAAERGSGLAVWLSLAHRLARTDLGVNVELLCTSGHEYNFLGGELYVANKAPAPATTRLWVHVGACAAARDWHEFPFGLRPLPSADAQRVLAATPDIVEPVRRGFAGISGLEAVYVAEGAMAGGELVNVLKAGYPSAVGLYGVHRYFHTASDDLRCASGELTQPVAAAYRAVLPTLVTATARHPASSAKSGR